MFMPRLKTSPAGTRISTTRKWVAKQSLGEMLEPGTLNSGRVLNYAAGFAARGISGPDESSGTQGGVLLEAEYLRFPDQHFSVVCFCNSGAIDPSTLAQRVSDHLSE